MASARREYEMLFRMSAQVGSGYATAFQKAQAQINRLQQEINDLGDSQKDISAYQRQQDAMVATQKKLETLQQQYDNIQTEIDQTEKYSSSLENQLLNKKLAIEKTAAALEQQAQKAQKLGDALEEAGIDTKELTKETERLTEEMNALKKEQEDAAEEAAKMGEEGESAIEAYQDALISSGLSEGLEKLAESLMVCIDASVEFESAITGVYKTVDGTDAQLAAISDEILTLTTMIPATTDEISGVAEAAGQLGIATEDVMSFTRVMIDLGESTNLTADDAASSLAKFANITGTAAADYSRLGSVIVDLGNNFATTEADIVAMSTRLASGGRLAGLTEAEIMGLAAAMSSVGIEAEAGGTAMTQTLNAIEMAVAFGEDSLVEYARIAGMTADEFAAAWEERPIEAIQAFITGLGKLDEQGESAVIVLDDLGLSGIRQSNMLKALGLASETLAGAVGTANEAWDENIALSVEASKRYATTASQQAMLQNSFNNFQIAIGDALAPTLKELYGIAADILNEITQFVKENPKIVQAVTAAAVVIGSVTAAVIAYTSAAKIAAAASKILSASIPGINVIAGVTLAVAGVTAALIALTPEVDAETKAVREMTNASRQEYYHIQELKKEYEEVCDVYGETSDQALYLAWQIDELDRSFELSKQTLSAWLEENREARNSMLEMLDTNRASIEEIDRNEATLMALANRLQELADQTDQTVATQEEMKAIVNELNASVPDLALNYNNVANGVVDVADAIDDIVAAQAAAQRYEEAQQGMVDAYTAEAEASQKAAEAEQEQAAAYDRLVKAQKAYEDANAKYTGDGSNPYGSLNFLWDDAASEYDAAKDAYDDCTKEVEDWQAAAAQAHSDYEYYKGIITDYAGTLTSSTSDMTYATNTWQGSTQSAFAAVQSEMEALIQEYNDVYNAALESFEGQFSLFDKASTESEEYLNATVSNAQAALDSQLAYWQSYSDNIEVLKGLSADQLGITEDNYIALMSYVQDGTAEAAGLAASIVSSINSGNEEAVADLATTIGEITTMREELAIEMSEWSTDFYDRMGELTQKMTETVEGLDLSEEATTAATFTINAYADAILAGMDPAVDAAVQVANAVAAALGTPIQYVSPTVPGKRPSFEIEGYASGTTSATAGWHLVGEEGPELAYFHGGETVLNAAQTASALTSGPVEASVMERSGAPISVSVSIQVNGDADSKTVETLNAYGEEFAQRVRTVIAEIQEEDDRRRY